MSVPSYTVTVEDPVTIDLAMSRLLIAPYGTTMPSSLHRETFWMDNAAILGFSDLGIVDEDGGAQIEITRTLKKLKLGRPKMLQDQVVLELDGKLTTVLMGNSNRQWQYAHGNVPPLNLYTEPASTYAASIASCGSLGQITLAASPGEAWAVGDYIVCGSTYTAIGTASNEAKISSLNALVVYLSPALAASPAADTYACKIRGTRMISGTVQIRDFSLVGIADCMRGRKIVWLIPHVQSGGSTTESYAGDDWNKLTLEFDLLSSSTTTYTGAAEQYLHERLHFFEA